MPIHSGCERQSIGPNSDPGAVKPRNPARATAAAAVVVALTLNASLPPVAQAETGGDKTHAVGTEQAADAALTDIDAVTLPGLRAVAQQHEGMVPMPPQDMRRISHAAKLSIAAELDALVRLPSASRSVSAERGRIVVTARDYRGRLVNYTATVRQQANGQQVMTGLNVTRRPSVVQMDKRYAGAGMQRCANVMTTFTAAGEAKTTGGIDPIEALRAFVKDDGARLESARQVVTEVVPGRNFVRCQGGVLAAFTYRFGPDGSKLLGLVQASLVQTEEYNGLAGVDIRSEPVLPRVELVARGESVVPENRWSGLETYPLHAPSDAGRPAAV